MFFGMPKISSNFTSTIPNITADIIAPFASIRKSFFGFKVIIMNFSPLKITNPR